ncbi:hypothetical protein [Ruminococcus albus]|uniref:Uncharacterized protein n=1 Tax=Ruminococcus albus TaxID=1264 RepID=A0A1H7P0F3_RUMAL|nr:hypothetical protein [Ruminococcus albus]SEL29116.1 hypothetical protein SAMN05216469_11813 [Ruminococcus albus]
MKIIKNELYTDVSNIDKLSELICADMGEPCLLIVHDNGSMQAGDEAKVGSIFSDLPYITAFASDEPYTDIAKFFDIVIPAEKADEYAENLFKDKTEFQIREITSCFVTARNGSTDDILNAESRAFYRLIAHIGRG